MGHIIANPPVADAGPSQNVFANKNGIGLVTLDGSGSYSDEGQPLTYFWTWVIDGYKNIPMEFYRLFAV